MLAVLELNEGRLGAIKVFAWGLWPARVAYVGAGIKDRTSKSINKKTEWLVIPKLRR